jgi:hypothetical protein
VTGVAPQETLSSMELVSSVLQVIHTVGLPKSIAVLREIVLYLLDLTFKSPTTPYGDL